tara:strand:- start:1240 stop:1731 length:492 start_codon:yes stop_codon:yes gene_type:complete
MKNLLFLFCICIVTINFSQDNINLNYLKQLKDVNGNSLNSTLFESKYILVCNLFEESSVADNSPYLKEVQVIYKNAFFNSVEHNGLTVLILIHFPMINYHQYPFLKDLIVVPVNIGHNYKIIQNLPSLIEDKNMLINNLGVIVDVDFLPKNIRLDLTKYLKRE